MELDAAASGADQSYYRPFCLRYLAHRAFTAAAILALASGLMFRFFGSARTGAVTLAARNFAHRAFAATRPLSSRLIRPCFGGALFRAAPRDSWNFAHLAL